MNLVLRATEKGDGEVVLHVAVDAAVIWTVTVPVSVWLSGGAEQVAEAAAARYAAKRSRLKGRQP
jgi:hypothetical protein